MGGQRETFFQDQVPEYQRERTASVSVLVLHLSIFLSFYPPQQPLVAVVHSHLHFFFLALFFSLIQGSRHYSTYTRSVRITARQKKKNTGAAGGGGGGGGRSTQVPLSIMTRYSYINVFFFPIRSTLPELSLPLRSQCVHSPTSCSKQNTCQRIPAMGARVYVRNSSS